MLEQHAIASETSIIAAHLMRLSLTVQNTVSDTAGKVNLAVSPLSFTRVAYPLIAGTSYEVIKSPGLLTLT